MALITINASQSDKGRESYRPDWLKWKGYYDQIPLLRGTLNAVADAVSASWTTKGTNGNAMAAILDNFEGNGKETFKMQMRNAVLSGMVCGDSFFEVVTNDDLGVENIVMLPHDNIDIIIKNGRIRRYEEIDGGAKWQPEAIFHYVNNPIGATIHGTSDIEPLQNLLIDLKQVQDDMSKIFHAYSTPLEVFKYESDDPAEIAAFKDSLRNLNNIVKKQMVIPKDLVEYERFSIPAGSVLDPTTWHKIIIDQILASQRVPDLALGTGTVNSEESARMKFSGFRQLVRMKQQMLEEQLQRQLFPQVFPEDTPTIEFSFAAEPQEEKFNRLRDMFGVVNGSALNEEIKGLLLIQILQEMGLVPKELNL